MNKDPKWIWQLADWPRFHWNDNHIIDGQSIYSLLRENHQRLGRLLGSSQGIADDDGLRSEMDALLHNAINTSAIEGERLDVASVRSSLARRLGLERTGLPAGTPQTDGLAEVLLDATHNPQAPLTRERLFHWHRLLFPDGPGLLTSIRVGELRGEEPMQVVSGPIGRYTVHFEAPPRQRLDAELDQFITWFNDSRDTPAMDPLLRAALTHLWFVTLHPFDDGNGRLARALTDLALAQADRHSIRFYAMASAIMERRNEYYRILETTQRATLDVTPWLHWFLGTLTETLDSALQRIDHLLLKAAFWRRHADSQLNSRQVKVLNRLLDAGPAGFESGINARKYGSLTRVSKATATRDLADLLQKGCLIRLPGGGRSTRYDINW